MESHDFHPLHLRIFHQSTAIINRLYALLNFTALIALIYYRLSSFPLSKPTTQALPHLLVFASEILLSLLWLFSQAYQWRPVSRTTFPERFPDDGELPPIDVFICTADPKKEPPFEVMNTVLSALALDYSPDKLSVYVSDDGASSLTLNGLREAWVFARSWIPFCRRFGIKIRCPKAYFSSLDGDDVGDFRVEYKEEKEKIKRKYEIFRARVTSDGESGGDGSQEIRIRNRKDQPQLIEVMNGNESDNKGQVELPLLVYISREKRPSHPHHFKAGALNVLFRVSGIMTNSPYVLVLDCDMYCNDPTSARQAMCFHLDPTICQSLAFVQFPQKFHNLSNNDIYDGQLRSTFKIRQPGMDGLQGPILSGTGFYIKREALYGNFQHSDPLELKQSFGDSDKLIMSVHRINQHRINHNRELSSEVQQESHFLAACNYEEHTLWGKQIGFLYHSVLEDFLTGFILHCKGWTSIYCNPPRPAFLGSANTRLDDALVQGTRWNTGLMEITFSKFCPFIYGPSKMSLLQTICYAHLSFQPLYSLSLWCLGTLPQLCLFSGIHIYPKVSTPWFMIFSFIFLGSQLKHLKDIVSTGGSNSIQILLNEQRNWMLRSVTAYTYGGLHAFLKLVGMTEPSFVPTNKVADEEQLALYQMGKFNFRTSAMFLVPIVSLVCLNMVSFIGGVTRMFIERSWDEMLGQALLSLYIIVVNYPVIEGMVLRKDKWRVPFSVSLLSLALSAGILCLGSKILLR